MCVLSCTFDGVSLRSPYNVNPPPLTEKSEQLEEALNKDVSSAIPADAKCFIPPMPVLAQGKEPNWPLLQSTGKIFEDHLANAAEKAQLEPQAPMFQEDVEIAGNQAAAPAQTAVRIFCQ